MSSSLRFSANLSFLFTERPFLDRCDAARAAGFRAVEFHFPYAWEVAAIDRAKRAADIDIVLFNLPAGDWEAGERGIACLPERREEFRSGVELAIEYAVGLGVPQLNCLAGLAPPGCASAVAIETLRQNLAWAAARLAAHGLTLLLEPLNTRDTPGFLIATSEAAIKVIDAVGAPNLRLQYDLYHAQVMEGNLAQTLESLLPRIGHIQLADNPGRHQPGTGEIRFPYLFEQLSRLAYSGWIGCEYRPSGRSEDSFDWMPRASTDLDGIDQPIGNRP